MFYKSNPVLLLQHACDKSPGVCLALRSTDISWATRYILQWGLCMVPINTGSAVVKIGTGLFTYLPGLFVNYQPGRPRKSCPLLYETWLTTPSSCATFFGQVNIWQ